ncbi:phenylalanine--tRNA ligase subunit alpha, partial [Candidatus Sumerlaeota bacterium]|nr:phenylalanine--tRNA ligase subunit alpha [Candidatus Sumerlaeota bacterium]
FEALNFPPDHPAHDLHDTFYLQGGGVLRTHTSPVQIRMMRRRRPPLAVIAPGVVYRPDADLTHTPMFHQVEGFLVDTRVRFSDLKGVLSAFLKRMMGPDVRYRFRPSYFPFTEPSAEIDIMWQVEGRDPEWLEVLGSGMIHPNVLRAGGYDPDEVTGFAFGLGVERFAMLKYAIPNIHLFYENDLRFLTQF